MMNIVKNFVVAGNFVNNYKNENLSAFHYHNAESDDDNGYFNAPLDNGYKIVAYRNEVNCNNVHDRFIFTHQHKGNMIIIENHYIFDGDLLWIDTGDLEHCANMTIYRK